MRRYKVIFYKSEWDTVTHTWKQNDLKSFYIYAFSFDKADAMAQQKLVEYQDVINDRKVAYWMDAIGDRKIDIPLDKSYENY